MKVKHSVSNLLSAMALFAFLAYLFTTAILNRVVTRIEALASILAAQQERLIFSESKILLSHLATMPEIVAMKPESCRYLVNIKKEAGGVFSVLGIGDKYGNAICSSESDYVGQLPTMSDREYYHKVKEADGIVMGEFTTSKITNKPTIHFAYPIKDQNGQFKGFVMAGIEVTHFMNTDIEQSFSKAGLLSMVIDRHGKLIFAYPLANRTLGENSVSAPLIAAIINGRKSNFVTLGYDGIYRIYSFRPIGGNTPPDMTVVAGVDLKNYLLYFAVGWTLSLAAAVHVYNRWWRLE